jgi:Flp pilus assembly protein TadD
MKIEDAFVHNLVQLGIIATLYGLHQNAQKIMEGARILRPENIYILVALAMTKINTSQLDDAIEILQNRVLKIDSENISAKCYLGMAFKYSGRENEANKLFREVINFAGEEDINEKNLAAELLLDDEI